MKRLLHLFRKELIELRRDPRLFSIVIIAPIVQLAILAYAATTDVRDVPVIVMDEDQSTESRELIERFDASANFTVVDAATSTGELETALNTRTAWMALTIPHDYSDRLRAASPATVQIVADGTDANSTNVALGYAGALISGYAAELAAAAGAAAPGPLVSVEVRVWFNPQLESRFFMIPGIVALLLLLVTTNLSSMAIVREREGGTLEQLSVTPIARWELIAGKLLPYAFIGMVDVVLVLLVSILWFEVPLRGSVWLLFAMCGVYLLSTLGLGLLVSTISRTQQQAMMTASFFFMIPMVFLSGFVFPIENMPEVVQPVTYLVPLRYFLIILRGIFLKGVGLETLWPQATALFAWGVVVLTLATLRSSKRLG
ncbi:MAG TPA: ABC transporter permease [Candidatus Limnocylindria bacterium]|nr:ABC transporter permease [Candidatus Limnocylindria bacterium]